MRSGKKIIRSSTIYKKEKGKYIPQAVEIGTEFWDEGFYLVRVRPGRSNTKELIDPDIAEFSCALKMFSDVVSEKLYELGELRAYDKPTKKVLKALNEMKLKLGKDYPARFKYKGVADIVKETIKEFEQKVEEVKTRKIDSEPLNI